VRRADDDISFSRVRIAAGSTLGHTLAAMGLAPRLVADILESAGNVFDLRQIRAGNRLEIGRSPQGRLLAVRYQIDADRMLDVRAAGDGFSADLQPLPSHIQEVSVTGQVRDSLFNAVADAGENPELAMRLADIFGWDWTSIPTRAAAIPSVSWWRRKSILTARAGLRADTSGGIQQQRPRLSSCAFS